MSETRALEADCVVQLEKLHAGAFKPGWSADDFRVHIENEFDDVLGAVSGGDVAGFIITRTQVDQSEIMTIVVCPDRRGQGIGKKLLAEAECTAQARGADIMFLDVAADNPSAQALYQNAGYQRCGTRKAYYRRQKGRVDALLFQKYL